jgi:hypothetical protein
MEERTDPENMGIKAQTGKWGRRIILSLLLLAVGACSVYVGLNPVGPVAEWQDRNAETERGIQKQLTEKSVQVLGVWAVLKVINGVINVLQSAQIGGELGISGSVNPFEILAPIDNTLDKISNVFLLAFGALILEKLLLAISVYAVFLVVIPICAFVSIAEIMRPDRSGNKKLYKIMTVSLLISLAVPFAVPVSFKLSSAVEKSLFSNNLSVVLSSINENGKNAKNMEEDLNKISAQAQAARTGLWDKVKGAADAAVSFITTFTSTIWNYTANAKDIGEALIKDTINYLMIFVVTNVIIPILTIYGLYRATKYLAKKIIA